MIEPILNSHGDKVLVDTPSSTKSCSGAAAVHDLQLSQLPHDSFTPLTEPLAVCRCLIDCVRWIGYSVILAS